MLIIDPGHCYEPASYDGQQFTDSLFVTFMKRLGSNYPGNEGIAHAGTNCQELIRVLIHRCLYINNQKPNWQTWLIIRLFRITLWLFEQRASSKKGYWLNIWPLAKIEEVPSCVTCGHIYTHSHPGEAK